jgi:hypothetical protein
MARILVQADDQQTVLLDERNITSEHMNDKHCAVQLMERLEWAICDESHRGNERNEPHRHVE